MYYFVGEEVIDKYVIKLAEKYFHVMKLNACVMEEGTVLDVCHSYCKQLWFRDEFVVRFVPIMRYF
jgi:hypothetical protein